MRLNALNLLLVVVSVQGDERPKDGRPPPPPLPPSYKMSKTYRPSMLLADMLSRRAALAPHCKLLPVSKWLHEVNSETALMVQVGANDHRDNYHNPDPGPRAVRRGWRALLFEPVPAIFASLRHSYANSTRVRMVNAAVCPAGKSRRRGEPLAACERRNHTMWSVDASNRTGNWGSENADGRCIDAAAPWVREIASLSKEHVKGMQFFLANRSDKCNKCARSLRRPLPPTCMSRVISDNLAPLLVPCACLRDELASESTVDLLMVDAEGYDLEVLKTFPFDAVRTRRVVYETLHMSPSAIRAAAALMMRAGFANIQGGLTLAPMSVWHHQRGCAL